MWEPPTEDDLPPVGQEETDSVATTAATLTVASLLAWFFVGCAIVGFFEVVSWFL